MKFFEYVHDRGGRVYLKSIDGPMTDFQSPVDVFQKTLQHEQMVTGMINKLYELALKENDYPTQVLLQWYINEQVEEEKNATQILDMLQRIGPSVGGLYQLDHRVGHRGAE